MCTDVSEEPTGPIMRVEECSWVTWVYRHVYWHDGTNLTRAAVSHLRRRLSLSTCLFFLVLQIVEVSFDGVCDKHSFQCGSVMFWRFTHISCQSLERNSSLDMLHRFEIDCTWKIADRPHPRHLHGRRLNYDCRSQYTVDIWRQGGKLAPEFFACFCLTVKIILDKNLFIFG